MSDTGNASFLDHLVADLRPVKRLRKPWVRASGWLAVVLAVAVVLATQTDLPGVTHRLAATTDMWLAVVGSGLTAVLAAIATFQLTLPDRRAAWALTPLPSLAIWVSASGLGCARSWLIPGTHDASLAETSHCLTFIIGVSVPLSVMLLVMLRRGYTMHPMLTGAMAGLAAAAAAATLLTFFHPFDASASDLAVHAIVVAFVVGVNIWLGSVILSRRLSRSLRG